MHYEEIIGTIDYLLWFEWQHGGSPHIHGLAWLRKTPNLEEILGVH